MKHSQKFEGFTLIELMIVVAIIAILAALALPAYQDYIIRTQVAEGGSLGDGLKSAVWDYISNTGHVPSTNTSAGLPVAASITGKFISSMKVQSGLIIATYSSGAPQRANSVLDSRTLVFSPIASASLGSIIWKCQPALGTVQQKYLPTICRIGSN